MGQVWDKDDEGEGWDDLTEQEKQALTNEQVRRVRQANALEDGKAERRKAKRDEKQRKQTEKATAKAERSKDWLRAKSAGASDPHANDIQRAYDQVRGSRPEEPGEGEA